RAFQLAVRAELRGDLPEDVLVGVADLKLSPGAGIEPVDRAEDVGDPIRCNLTDPDPDRVLPTGRVGSNLLCRGGDRRGRRLAMLHVDRPEKMQVIADERPAERAAVLRLREVRSLLVCRVLADQALVLQEGER